MQKIIDLTETGKLTDEHEKAFIRAVTYAEDRLRYFEEHREIAKWAYEATESACRNSKRLNRRMEEELSDAGRTLQFYDDVVAMLKAEMEKEETK